MDEKIDLVRAMEASEAEALHQGQADIAKCILESKVTEAKVSSAPARLQHDGVVISKFSKLFPKVEPHMDRRCTGDTLVIYW